MLDFCDGNGTVWDCIDRYMELGITNQLLIGAGLFIAIAILLQIINLILRGFED